MKVDQIQLMEHEPGSLNSNFNISPKKYCPFSTSIYFLLRKKPDRMLRRLPITPIFLIKTNI